MPDSHPTFRLIVAVDQEYGIGKNNNLPWHLPGDLKHFKEITARTPQPRSQNVVIMGRKTWESLPEKFRPLPGRTNVVLTRHADCKYPDGVLVAGSLDQALEMIKNIPGRGETFVIGGGSIFKDAIAHPFCRTLYLTFIKQAFGCDVFFPEIPPAFKEFNRSADFSENGITYHFADYQKAS
ncbi:MAG: dihydrofolate reductase, partial [Sedimentisphaerales bacterium]|nr:dihydrofolate reductase [Sedimentisphaerales bacterium]